MIPTHEFLVNVKCCVEVNVEEVLFIFYLYLKKVVANSLFYFVSTVVLNSSFILLSCCSTH